MQTTGTFPELHDNTSRKGAKMPCGPKAKGSYGKSGGGSGRPGRKSGGKA
jgi:hypothetical protein